ncbi:MAG: formylmethanofuran dehydrogenase subunit E family protein [Verrucomicrobiota bacterium]|jgi:formylmethanofuran dehydrogenase subunit E
MKKHALILVLMTVIIFLTLARLFAHDGEMSAATQSTPGPNVWNQAQEPTNWWNEIKQMHGHVGPWNVLGWRMGKAARRELNAAWGQHELDVICYIPLKMPYSCLADGLVVGTGNSIGRLDIRLGEVMTMADIHISVRRKDSTGPVLLLKPDLNYLEKIRHQPDDQLGSLAREGGQLPEEKLFAIEKLPQSDQGLKTH